LFAGCCLLGVVGLIALGVWQLERRIWKLALIDRVEQRVHASPQPIPAPVSWPAVDAAKDEYRRVTVTGRFMYDHEALVQAVTEDGRGFWVVTPMRTADGNVVLVNRGFVPPEWRDPATGGEGDPRAMATVTGLLRMTEPKGAFLRTNDPVRDRWYSRDVAAIAAARNLSGAAPFFVDADATLNPGRYPIGGLTVVAFPNNHLIYALTWFALAFLLAGAYLRIVRGTMSGARISSHKAALDAGACIDAT
jgi:surfeit locus 1 family protein